jgi:cytochrome c peroxidase
VLHWTRRLLLGWGVGLFLVAAYPLVAQTPFPACNPVNPQDKQLVAQGRHLFADAHVFNQKQPFRACITCHRGPNLTDNQNHTIAPTGDAARTFPRSTPSLRQRLSQTGPYTWDGRAQCLQQAAFGAITSPVESNGTVSPDAAGQAQLDALAAYLLSIQPPKPLTTLDPNAVERGKVVFDSKPCASCHAGRDFTDNQLHNHSLGDQDPGAALVGTGGVGAFDTPSLRGIRVSAPYFHNGRNGIPAGSTTPVATDPRQALRQVVEFYDTQFGLGLTEQQKRDLVEFLMSL